jgi:GxxExxY protein
MPPTMILVLAWWVCMTSAYFFLDSLVVSALVVPQQDMRYRIPYLRNRCAGIACVSPLSSNGGVFVATNNPTKRAGLFHYKGKPFTSSSTGGEIVKRFPVSTSVARESSIPHRVIRSASVSTKMSNRDVKIWSFEWSNLLELTGQTYFELGPNHSEKAYQTSLMYRLYQQGIPSLVERCVYVHENNTTVLAGRVDLEVNQRFLLELKICPPTSNNVHRDRKQLRRYITAYKKNNEHLENAALVYFSCSEVRIIEVPIDEE